VPPLAFDIVSDEQGFRSLEPEWRDLLERVRRRHHYQSFDWTWRSWEHIARNRGQKLFVVVGRRAGRAVLIWPLARYRKLLWRTAEWIGAEHSYYSDVLVEDAPEAAEWLEAAWSWAAKRVDYMWLSHMTDDAVLVPILERIEGVRRDVQEAPYVDCSEWPDWDAYYRTRTRNLKRDLVRRRRRLEEQGDVGFRIVTSADEARETLDWMLEHKADWMKSKGIRLQDGGVDTADMQGFYRAVVADACASDNLCLATLTLDGKVLAAQLGLLARGTLAGNMTVYGPGWEKYAPGKLLMADLVRWTLENNCAIYDLMPAGESFKYLWARKEARITTYLVPCSLRGRVLVAWRRSRLGAAVRRLLRLRPADLPRIIRNRFSGRSSER
jgi:CelD/BcsL family acetyltransferase involved in cellulose biosynthesis